MFKRYELHNHTDQSDARITCRQLIDHNTTSGQRIIRGILEEHDLPIQCAYGMEYTTYYGHIVCPVLTRYVPWDSINRNNPELLFEACKRAGAVTGVAHPFAYGDPFARGCRFDMTIRDFAYVDYIEIINNGEPLRDINEKGISWWEELVLKGEKLAACAGMDLHELTDLSMKFATYAEGSEGGDAVEELRYAIDKQRTWVSRGMLVTWAIEGERIRFSLVDVHKPGFIPSDRYTLTLKSTGGEREFDISSGEIVLPLNELAEIEIPKLYGGEAALDNLVCVAPVIRK